MVGGGIDPLNIKWNRYLLKYLKNYFPLLGMFVILLTNQYFHNIGTIYIILIYLLYKIPNDLILVHNYFIITCYLVFSNYLYT